MRRRAASGGLPAVASLRAHAVRSFPIAKSRFLGPRFVDLACVRACTYCAVCAIVLFTPSATRWCAWRLVWSWRIHFYIIMPDGGHNF